MRKVSEKIQNMIVKEYLWGTKYKDIQLLHRVSRWNIQDALSKFGIKTNRIKSPPRLPGSKKLTGRLMDRYHDGDYLPPMKVNKNNPVLADDLDYQERYDLDGTDNAEFEDGKYLEIGITENGEVKYIER